MTSLKRFAAPACALLLCGACATAPSPAVAPPADGVDPQPWAPAPFVTNERGLDRRNLDESARACVDFYQYANGGWLARNTIPADRSSWSTLSKWTRIRETSDS